MKRNGLLSNHEDPVRIGKRLPDPVELPVLDWPADLFKSVPDEIARGSARGQELDLADAEDIGFGPWR